MNIHSNLTMHTEVYKIFSFPLIFRKKNAFSIPVLSSLTLNCESARVFFSGIVVPWKKSSSNMKQSEKFRELKNNF